MTAKKTTSAKAVVKAPAKRAALAAVPDPTPTETPELRHGIDRIEQLGLSKMFRAGSTSRKAAEILLSGESITKAELMRRTGVVETVVPRTITWLRQAGIEVVRTQDKATKQATYRAILPVVDQAPEGSFEYHAQGPAATVKLVSMEAGINPARRGQAAAGPVATLTLTSELGTVTGSAPMSPLLAALSQDGLTLSRVILLPGGKQEWMLGFLPNTLLVSDITYVK